MEKLTLKELAPYLPYGLKIDTSKLCNGYSIMTMCDKSGLSNISISDVIDEHPFTTPILRPLSELTKEIEHNGEKFVPQSKLSHLDLEWLITSENLIMKTNYEDALQLLEWKFDVFGLLDKNLAVPVTEEFNPYK